MLAWADSLVKKGVIAHLVDRKTADTKNTLRLI